MSACGINDTSKSNQELQAYVPTLQVNVEIISNRVYVTTTTDMSIRHDKVGSARRAGEGHIHMYLDNREKETVTAKVKEYADLPRGQHTLRVSLHNNDHTPYDMAKTIEFEIK
jgi:hypothetical protein